MSGTDNIIAGTAFEIVARCFYKHGGSDRNSLRLKNLTRMEAINFIEFWQHRSAERGLTTVRLLVASDSHEDFPQEFRAEPGHSITYYRNNNESGLVYIETKVESDEQGLKNIFTLRDVNFLDGTFDEEDQFSVAEEMVEKALDFVGFVGPRGATLFRERLVEVLRELNAAGQTIPLRKYAAFILGAAELLVSGPGIYSADEINALIGSSLVNLDMFPDELWRQSPGRVARRLLFNLLRSELAASPSTDLDPEKTAQDCRATKFVDEVGKQYEPEIQAVWRDECATYCFHPSRELRQRIPYGIFQQVFSKDLKGLPLGQRLGEEIAERDPSRKSEYERLDVANGLNSRSADDARRFMESEPTDPNDLPLKDLLSKQSIQMVAKLASPNIERVKNPLIKLSQVAADFRARNDLGEGDFCIKLRPGAAATAQHLPSIGLFAFLYGRSLVDICSAVSDGIGSVSLEVDVQLVHQHPVPPLKEVADSEEENSEAGSSEEEEGIVWLPVPLEFLLVNSKDGSEIDSEVGVEWLPDDLYYLVLFWVSVAGPDRGELNAELRAPSNRVGEAWIAEVAQRVSPFRAGITKYLQKEVISNPIISRLLDIRGKFRDEAKSNGLSSAALNNTFDEWSSLLAEARINFVPDGDVPAGLLEFLNSDCIVGFDGSHVLMLQSHPLRLRWISSYLAKSSQLAIDAIEGSLKLNDQNKSFYLNWIEDLSPHQQPAIHTAVEGDVLFASSECGWTERFQKNKSSSGVTSGGRIHSSLVSEIVRQVIAYLHAHPYKSDGLKVLIVTSSASALPSDIASGVRKGEFKNLAMTIEFVAPKQCWDEAARQFELVDTENRLSGEGSLFPPVQLNFHDLDGVKSDPNAVLGQLVFDLTIIPQLLDDNVSIDFKTEDETMSLGKFDPLLDSPTYIASGLGASALWVSQRPRMPDAALSDWSTLVVRHEKRSPVAADRPESSDFVDIRINFHNSARLFGDFHKRSHWVITLERHITREQIEKLETRPDVLSLREGIGPGGLFTLIVSSNAGKDFVVDRLTRKLKRIATSIGRKEMAEKQALLLAGKIYDEARQIAPRLTLDALGISRVTEEILGLSVGRQISDRLVPAAVVDGFTAWVSLDEHPEWFGSLNVMRADMLRLSVGQSVGGLEVDILVMESKLRRSGYDAHGAEQVLKTIQLFDAVLPKEGIPDSLDGKLWREVILGAVDTVSEEAVFISQIEKSEQRAKRSRVSEEIRSKFRDREFASVKISGLYSICEYTHPREITEEQSAADSRVLIVQTGGSILLDRMDGSGLLTPFSSYIGDQTSGSVDGVLVGRGSEDNGNLRFVAVADPVEPTIQEEPNEGTPHKGIAPVIESRSAPSRSHLGKSELDRRYQIMLDTFSQYGVSVLRTDLNVEHAIEGPASILFRVRPGKGVDPKKLSDKRDALKLALELEASQDMRFDIDKGYVTIDVPKSDRDRYFVDASSLWSRWSRPEVGLKVPLGEDRFGNVVEIDFSSSNSPHLLIGGTTGSGKSEALNTILAGFTKHYSPEEVQLHLIDPKGTELAHLAGSAHLGCQIGWDDGDAIEILDRAVEEMQARYSKFKQIGVRTLEDYNSAMPNGERVPRWVIVLDEYADVTSDPDAKKTIEGHLKRLAQKARAAGIHVIIATQKPDASVISTNLRSNLPAQLALRVRSGTESRVIMDDPGAESLTGKGDAFFKESGILTRVQCAKI